MPEVTVRWLHEIPRRADGCQLLPGSVAATTSTAEQAPRQPKIRFKRRAKRRRHPSCIDSLCTQAAVTRGLSLAGFVTSRVRMKAPRSSRLPAPQTARKPCRLYASREQLPEDDT